MEGGVPTPFETTREIHVNPVNFIWWQEVDVPLNNFKFFPIYLKLCPPQKHLKNHHFFIGWIKYLKLHDHLALLWMKKILVTPKAFILV